MKRRKLQDATTVFFIATGFRCRVWVYMVCESPVRVYDTCIYYVVVQDGGEEGKV